MGGVIPYRKCIVHFYFVAVILMVLGGFLWHSCRTFTIILEVLTLKKKKNL